MTGFLIPVLRKIAVAAAVFALILCALIVVNYVQVKRSDPLNTPAMKALTEKLQVGAGDDQLRQEIRELDLLARKAFFTSRWQVRVGGYLLFFSILVAAACLKTEEMLRKTMPVVPNGERKDFWGNRKINLNWVAYTGLSIVAFSLVIVFLTNRELGRQINLAVQDAGRESPVGEPGKGNPDPGSRDKGTFLPATVEPDTAAMNARPDSIFGNVAIADDGFPSEAEIRKNFPAFRGPNGLGKAFQKNIPVEWDGNAEKNIRWKAIIPLPGYNSPIIWGDRIFLAGASDGKREVYCFSLSSGKMLWRTEPGTIAGSPGQPPKVTRETGFSAPTMTTDGRRAYAIFANGDIAAFDFQGTCIWAKNLGMPQNHYGHSSSLIMYRNLVIVQYDQRRSAAVIALHGNTGEQAWKTSRNVQVSWASPILAGAGGSAELILLADPYAAAYDPLTGKERWQIECISGEVGPSAAYAGGVVFTVNETSRLAAVGLEGGPKILWENNDYLSDIPSPLATEHYLFLVTSYGMVVCYDSKTGEKYWEQDLGTPVFASPVLAEERVYLMDKNGVMHIFKADKTFTMISKPALGEGSVCTPAFADGKIVIRGEKHLFCIGK